MESSASRGAARPLHTLQAQLAPVANELRKTRALIQPISQIVLRLKPKGNEDRFSDAVRQVLKWMDNRAGRRLPDGAWQFESFELSDVGAQRVAAVSLAEARFWSARLDDADKAIPLRTWITEVGIGEAPDGVLLGARLICATRGDDAPFVRSVPGFAKGLIKAGPAELDGIPICAADVPLVASEEDVDELVRLLEQPTRRAPVLVFALPDESTDASQTVIDPVKVLGDVLGVAHVRVLTAPASFQLTKLMGKELSVFRQAVRIYRPGFKRWQDVPTRHPLILPQRVVDWPDGGSTAFQRWLVDLTLAISVQRPDREEELPSFNTVRQLAARIERDRLRQQGGSSAELLALYETDNDRLRREVEEQKQQYEGLLALAERERDVAEQRSQEAAGQVMALRARVRSLDERLAAAARSAEREIPTTLEGFEEWCRTHLSGSVEVHNRALQGVKKSVFNDPTLIYRALLLLRDVYVPMKLDGGADRLRAWEAACRELQLEDSPIGDGWRDHPEQYTVMFGGRPCRLDKHLKRGKKHDERMSFRLYYFWDEETQTVIVGWLPSHLDNSLT